jgi:hypothetical protein
MSFYQHKMLPFYASSWTVLLETQDTKGKWHCIYDSDVANTSDSLYGNLTLSQKATLSGFRLDCVRRLLEIYFPKMAGPTSWPQDISHFAKTVRDTKTKFENHIGYEILKKYDDISIREKRLETVFNFTHENLFFKGPNFQRPLLHFQNLLRFNSLPLILESTKYNPSSGDKHLNNIVSSWYQKSSHQRMDVLTEHNNINIENQPIRGLMII